ncbi:MAG: hypothetical protein ABGY96_05945 [bacterium]|nr:hypothetical protein [Gammaproteobacteria bacterium]
MAIHRLEVYLDSYNNEPFIKDFEDAISLSTISTMDEQKLEEWISHESGQPVDIKKHLKIEDVRRRHSSLKQYKATCLRVKFVP